MTDSPNADVPSIRVVIVDDDPLVRSGLSLILGADPSLSVLADAPDGKVGVDAAVRLGADVVLMDLHMPKWDGVWATKELARRAPGVRVLILTAFDSDAILASALASGAAGFLLKTEAPDAIIRSIHEVAAGARAFSAPVLERMVTATVEGTDEDARPSSFPEDVTDRERDVAELVAQGLTNAQIADRLMVGAATVKTHVSALLMKFAVANRVQLAIAITRALEASR